MLARGGNQVPGDELPTAEIGVWAIDKYRVVELYDELFSTGMKQKWETRVYIDLYAGPGYASLRGRKRILLGSPLRALGVPHPFDKYIFCESDPSLMNALQIRVSRLFPNVPADFILGDCNDQLEEICNAIPPYSKENRVLSFCFADPYDISIKFSTVRKLSTYYLDFLFLLALYMDANRNLDHYVSPANHKIDDFLGLPEWRLRWQSAHAEGIGFPQFLAQEYCKQMETLGYLPLPFHKMRHIRSDDKNLPLYSLALFSRHPLAHEYWDQVLEYSSDQRSLFGR